MFCRVKDVVQIKAKTPLRKPVAVKQKTKPPAKSSPAKPPAAKPSPVTAEVAAPAAAPVVAPAPTSIPLSTPPQPSELPAQVAADTGVAQQLRDELELAKLDGEVSRLELEAAREEISDLMREVQGLQLRSQAAEDAGAAGDTGTQLKQAIEAVVLLRDEVALKDQELAAAAEMIRDDGRAIQKLEATLVQRTEQLDTVSQKMLQIKQQMETASGGMVEQLSTKLQTLEQENEVIKAENKELVSLIALNDDIIEEQAQSEAAAVEQFDAQVNKIEQLSGALRGVAEENRRYKSACMQLKKDLEAAQTAAPPTPMKTPARLPGMEAADQSLPPTPLPATPAVAGPSSTADVAAVAPISTKAQAAKVLLELRTLELEQANAHLEMVKLFLPDAFFRDEHDGIAVAMLLGSLQKKAGLIMKEVQSQFRLKEPADELIAQKAFTVDQLSFGHDLATQAAQLGTASAGLLAGLERDPESYTELAGQYSDLKIHMAAVDDLLEAMRAGGLGPAISLDKLRRGVLQFQAMANITLNAKNQTDADFASRTLTVLTLVADAVRVELVRLQQFFSRTTGDGNRDSAFSELLARLEDWEKQAHDIVIVVRKCSRNLPDPVKAKLALKPETTEALSKTLGLYSKLAVALRATGTAAWNHMHGSSTGNSLSVGQAVQIAEGQKLDFSVDGVAVARIKAQGADESMLPLHGVAVITEVTDILKEFCRKLEHGECDSAVSDAGGKLLEPWKVRGDKMREAISESLGFETEIEKKQEEIRREQAKVKAHARTISENKVNLDAAIKRVDTVKQEMQRKLDEKTHELEETTRELNHVKELRAEDHANADVDAKEAAAVTADLQKKLDALSKGSRRNASIADVRAARLKIDGLELALRAVRSEVAALRGRNTRDQLKALPPLSTSYHLAVEPDECIKKASTKAAELLKDMRKSLSSPMVVNLVRPSAPNAEKKAPAAQVPKWRAPTAQMTQLTAAVQSLKNRNAQVTKEVLGILGSETAGGGAGTKFSSFLSSSFSKVLDERKKPMKAGLIKIPKMMSKGTPGIHEIAIDSVQLRLVHDALVR